MRTSLRWYRAALVVSAMAALAAFTPRPAVAADEGHFDRTLTVSGPVDLDVQTGSGDITVRPGNAGSVEIHAKIKADNWHFGSNSAQIEAIEKNPPIQQEGNTIRIGHVEDRDLLRHVSISYEIITPKETKLHSTSGSGDEKIDGIAGPVETTSGSGGLHVHDIGSDVRANTGSGDVTSRTFTAARESPPAAAASRPPALPARSLRQLAAATSSSNKRPRETWTSRPAQAK